MKITVNDKLQIPGLLTLIMLFVLSGCGNSNDGNPGNNGGGLPANSALIVWDGSTVNADASSTPLADLAGYRVYMSTTSGVYSVANIVAQISAVPTGGGSESFQIDNLTPGTYYFRVTAYDNASPANESAPSVEVSKTIQ